MAEEIFWSHWWARLTGTLQTHIEMPDKILHQPNIYTMLSFSARKGNFQGPDQGEHSSTEAAAGHLNQKEA